MQGNSAIDKQNDPILSSNNQVKLVVVYPTLYIIILLSKECLKKRPQLTL